MIVDSLTCGRTTQTCSSLLFSEVLLEAKCALADSPRFDDHGSRGETTCASLQIDSPAFIIRLNYRERHPVKRLAVIRFK